MFFNTQSPTHKQKAVSSLERWRARRFAESSARIASRHDASAAMALPTASATPCRFALFLCTLYRGHTAASISRHRSFCSPMHRPAGLAAQMPSAPPHRLTFRAVLFRQTLPHFRHYAVRQPVRCDLWSTLTSPPASFVPIPYDWPCSRKVRLGLLLVFASVLFLRVLCLLGALSSAGSRGVICSSYSLKRCATLSRSA